MRGTKVIPLYWSLGRDSQFLDSDNPLSIGVATHQPTAMWVTGEFVLELPSRLHLRLIALSSRGLQQSTGRQTQLPASFPVLHRSDADEHV